MIGKKINQLATELAPESTDLTIIGDPTTGVSKKITIAQLGAIFSGAVSFYNDLASFPVSGDINVIYCAKDTQKLYLWSGSAYVEVFPSQALLDTYQLRSEKGNANGYASLDSLGKVPISQLPSSIMEYKGTWNAATNTPTLANGTGDTGDVYICNVAGTVNFGAGPITFAVGDYVIYSGTIWQRSSGAVGTVTSVAASITGNSVSISGSPIVTSGTLAFAFAGNATQYVRGDGQLATLPTNGGGGGASVSYYLNGSINQGTIGGVTYYEMNKTPIIGAGTDFTTSSNGYIASFLTDANDPALLNIPAGNFNFETYFEASSGGGSPTFYIELYKYDGTNFTLIASNSTSPKLINDATNIEAYFSALAVPQTTLTLTDRLAIRIYVTTAGRTITLHTENNTLCQVITTFTTGLTALNGLTSQVQYLATGTSGTDFNIASASATHTFNLPTASATNRGALSSADWTTFNNKQNALTLTTTGSSGASTLVGATLNIPNYTLEGLGGVPTSRTLTINGTTFDLSANRTWSVGTVTSVAALTIGTTGTDLSSTVANGTTSPVITLNVPTASATNRGALSSADWTTFNNKQSALTNPVTGTGTTNYLPKFTGTSTIGNSVIQESSSNIGIGVSPSYKLEVYDSSTDAVALFNSASANGGHIRIAASGNVKSFIGSAAGFITSGGVDDLGLRAVGAIRFATNGAGTDMLLDASGNLGLGVTPSAWGSTVRALQFENGGSIASNQSTQVSFNNNVYSVPGTNDYYISSAFASRYIQFQGQHIWSTAPSGTAGNAISFTQAMTLNASGNLSIGNTNDTFKLDVSGTGRFTQFLYLNSASNTAGAQGLLFYNSGPNSGSRSWRLSNDQINWGDFAIQVSTTQTGSTYITPLNIASTGAATFSSSVTATTGIFSISAGTPLQAYQTSATNSTTAIIRQTGAGGNGNQDIGLLVDIQGVADNDRIANFRYYDGSTYTSRMAIMRGGNVGIGTTSPSQKLSLGSPLGIAGTATTYGSNDQGSIMWSYEYTGIFPRHLDIIAAGSPDGTNGGGNIRFFTNPVTSGANSVERMRITSGGNVEINTGSIKTGEPDTGYGRAAFKIGTRQSGSATGTGGYIPISIDGTVYFINLFTSTP